MKDKVYIGELKDRISILHENSYNSILNGESLPNWLVLKSCWANYIENSAVEDEEGRVRSIFTSSFIVRYDKQLIKGKAAEMLVQDSDGFEYNIVSVDQKVPKQYLQIKTVRRE